jgi:hypothetical protein
MMSRMMRYSVRIQVEDLGFEGVWSICLLYPKVSL